MKKLSVCVLFGGVSPEHEVSLRSAESVLNHLDKEKYNIFPVGITKTGDWVLYGGTDFCIRTWSNSLIALPFPAWSMYISAPIAAVVMLYFAALNLAGEFKPDRKGENWCQHCR